MATITRTVSDLTFEVNERSDRDISLRVTFTEDNPAQDDWIIDVPRMVLDQLRDLIRELEYSVSAEIEGDDPVRDLIAQKNYTIRVQR